jgi:asparagine synthase (glutamine-hydrolysing)
MCGIVAAVGQRSLARVNGCAALKALAHRGPDAEGSWRSADDSAWLGHRRLAIVDLSPAGRQPMHNEDQAIWLVCNGEIYNYPTLRARLEGVGHQFYSHSDNEVILHAYESWGEDCVDYLQGMFAFVLWDEKERKLLAARDPVGIKPLYYAEQNGCLALASEAGALIKLLDHQPAPEPVALAYIMTIGYIPSPWGIWQGVHKLEPSHSLTWRPGQRAQLRKYWEPPRAITGTKPPTVEQLRERFEPVLREHLLSDVPIGLFLSGGLDSISIATGLREIGQPVQALTVGFPDSIHSEAPTAEATAAHLGLPHETIPLSVGDIDELLSHVSIAYDEPQGYSALLTMFLLSEVTASRFKVALAGDGGDELFGGYTWYQALESPLGNRWRIIYQALQPLVRRSASPQTRKRAAKAFARASVLHRHAWRLFPRFLPEEAESLLSPMGVRFSDSEMLEPFRRHFEPTLPLRRALQRVDLMTFCTDSILAKVDKASMAHSLEVRVPWLDRRIVDWALSCASDPRDEEESKPVLRDYLRPRVPAGVLQRPKQGFSLRGLLDYDWTGAIESIRQGPWVQNGVWAKNWEQLLAPGVPYREHRIWTLLCLTKWGQAWLE